MDFNENIQKELRNPEFAKYYGEDQAKMELALAMFAARSKLKLTQIELGRKLSISQPYIAKLEKGDVNPTIGHVGGLLALVGLRLTIHTDDLISDDGRTSQPVVTQAETNVNAAGEYPVIEYNTQNTTNPNPVNAIA